MITQAPRGTKDWFGKDMDQRTYLENIFKDLCASYNIHEIITPVLSIQSFFREVLEKQQTLSRKRCIH